MIDMSTGKNFPSPILFFHTDSYSQLPCEKVSWHHADAYITSTDILNIDYIVWTIGSDFIILQNDSVE